MLSCSMVTTPDCPAAAVLSVVLCGTVPCRVVLCCAVLPPCCADQIRRPSNWNAAEAIGLGPVTPDPTIDTTGTADGFCWGGGCCMWILSPLSGTLYDLLWSMG
jgi:hypothetical protein